MNAPSGRSDNYYAEAATWAEDRRASRQRSVRVAWIIAGIAAGVAALEALALVALVPLKNTQLQTILVDRQSGFVTTVDPARPERISADSALTRSFLAQYVVARETFDIATLKQDYRRISALSAPDVVRRYTAEVQASNPASRLASLPRTTVIAVRVLSISPISAKRAMVRFETQQSDAGSASARLQNWVAMVGYRYSPQPMPMEDRLVNPLGFEVTSYRRDAEALPRDIAPVVVPQ